jgi:hypothetical protein
VGLNQPLQDEDVIQFYKRTGTKDKTNQTAKATE